MKIPTDDEMKEFQRQKPRTYKRLTFWAQVIMVLALLGIIYFIYYIFA